MLAECKVVGQSAPSYLLASGIPLTRIPIWGQRCMFPLLAALWNNLFLSCIPSKSAKATDWVLRRGLAMHFCELHNTYKGRQCHLHLSIYSITIPGEKVSWCLSLRFYSQGKLHLYSFSHLLSPCPFHAPFPLVNIFFIFPHTAIRSCTCFFCYKLS